MSTSHSEDEQVPAEDAIDGQMTPAGVREALARRLKSFASRFSRPRGEERADLNEGEFVGETAGELGDLDESAEAIETAEGGRLRGWFQSLMGLREVDAITVDEETPGNDASKKSQAGVLQLGVNAAGAAGGAAVDATRDALATALITGVRAISNERDRDEVLKWFANAEHILTTSDSKSGAASELYRSVNTRALAGLLFNTAKASINNYRGSSLPLALKIASPATAIGASVLGAQGAGIVAFGTGIGLPVVLLLFLGVVGVGTILEAFVKDPTVRDPLTRLMITFAQLEATRRANKAFLDALRADAMVPRRAEVPAETAGLVAHLRAMDPVDFERHVLSFFEGQGHSVGLTARSNDYGVDGYVFHPDGVIVVQCKRHSEDNAVGRPLVQQFKGVIEEQKALRGYIVTTSRFTDEARSSAEKNDRVRLVDWEELVVWHEQGKVEA